MPFDYSGLLNNAASINSLIKPETINEQESLDQLANTNFGNTVARQASADPVIRSNWQNQLEKDFMTMSSGDFANKYGQNIASMAQEKFLNEAAPVQGLTTGYTTLGQDINDFVNLAGGAAISGILDVAGAASGLVGDRYAQEVQNRIENFKQSDWVNGQDNSLVSQSLTDRQLFGSLVQTEDEKYHQQLRQQAYEKAAKEKQEDIANGTPSGIASLREKGKQVAADSETIGMDFKSSLRNQGKYALMANLAQGFGSFGSSIPIGGLIGKSVGLAGKGLAAARNSALAEAVIDGAGLTGTGTKLAEMLGKTVATAKESSTVANKAMEVAKKVRPSDNEGLGWTIANMVLEGSAAGQQTRQAINALSPEELAKSDDFKDLYASYRNQGLSENTAFEAAKAETAAMAARRVGWATGIIAAGLSKLSEGVAGIGSKGIKQRAIGSLGEFVEETGTETSGQSLGNLAEQVLAGQDTWIGKGVGEAGAGAMIGTVGGTGATAVIRGARNLKDKRDVYKAKQAIQQAKEDAQKRLASNEESIEDLRSNLTDILGDASTVKSTNELFEQGISITQEMAQGAKSRAFESLQNQGNTNTLSEDKSSQDASTEAIEPIQQNTQAVPSSQQQQQSTSDTSVQNSLEKAMTLSNEDAEALGTKQTNAIQAYKEAVINVIESQKKDSKVDATTRINHLNKLIGIGTYINDSIDAAKEELKTLNDNDPAKAKLQKQIDSLEKIRNTPIVQSATKMADSFLTNIKQNAVATLNELIQANKEGKLSDVDLRDAQTALEATLNIKPISTPSNVVNDLLQNADKLKLTEDQKDRLEKLKSLKDIQDRVKNTVSEKSLFNIDKERALPKGANLSNQDIVTKISSLIARGNARNALLELNKLKNYITSGMNLVQQALKSDGSDFSYNGYNPVTSKFEKVKHKGYNKGNNADQNALDAAIKHISEAALAYESLRQLYPQLEIPPSKFERNQVGNWINNPDLLKEYDEGVKSLIKAIQDKAKIEEKQQKQKLKKYSKLHVESTQQQGKTSNDIDDITGEEFADNTIESDDKSPLKEERLVLIQNGKTVRTKKDMNNTEKEVAELKEAAFNKSAIKGIRVIKDNAGNVLHEFTQVSQTTLDILDGKFKKGFSIPLGVENVKEFFFKTLANNVLYNTLAEANGHTNPLNAVLPFQAYIPNENVQAVLAEVIKNISFLGPKDLILGFTNTTLNEVIRMYESEFGKDSNEAKALRDYYNPNASFNPNVQVDINQLIDFLKNKNLLDFSKTRNFFDPEPKTPMERDVFKPINFHKELKKVHDAHPNLFQKAVDTQDKNKSEVLVAYENMFNKLKEKISAKLEQSLTDVVNKLGEQDNIKENLKRGEIKDSKGNVITDITQIPGYDAELSKIQEIYEKMFIDPDSITQKDINTILGSNYKHLLLTSFDKRTGNIKWNDNFLDTAVITLMEYLLKTPEKNMVSNEEKFDTYAALVGNVDFETGQFMTSILSDLTQDFLDNLGLKLDTKSEIAYRNIFGSFISQIFDSVAINNNEEDNSKLGLFIKHILPYGDPLLDKDGNPVLDNEGNQIRPLATVYTMNTDIAIGSKTIYQLKHPSEGTFRSLNFDEAVKETKQLARAAEQIFSTSKKDYEYWMDQRAVVPHTQLHSITPISREQRLAVESANNVKYFFDRRRGLLIKKLGLQGMLELFGYPIGDREHHIRGDNSKLINVHDLESKRGKNGSIMRAFETIIFDEYAISEIALTMGIPESEVYRTFGHAITAVGRMQQLGTVTPQGDKVMRMYCKPTVSRNLDLTDEKNRTFLYISIAQGLGLKVGNMTYQEITDTVEKLMNDRDILKLAVRIEEESTNLINKERRQKLENILNQQQGKDQIDLTKALDELSQIDCIKALYELQKQYTGEDNLNEAAMDSLIELSQLISARIDNDGQFPTSYDTFAYIEADGATNGFIMSTLMNSLGNFTTDAQFTENLAKGGIVFSNTPMSKAEIMQSVPGANKDIYNTVASRVGKKIFNSIQKFKEEISMTDEANAKKVIPIYEFLVSATLGILDRYYLDHVDMDEAIFTSDNYQDKFFSIARNAVKDIVTQGGNYFAGNRTTAVNAWKETQKELYKTISQMLTNVYNNTRDPNNSESLKDFWNKSLSEQELANALSPNLSEEDALAYFRTWSSAFNAMLNFKIVMNPNTGNMDIQRVNNYNIAEELNTPLKLKNFTLKAGIVKKLSDTAINNIENIYTAHVVEAARELFGGDILEALTLGIECASDMAMLHREATRREVQIAESESPDLGLSENRMREVRQRTNKYNPMVHDNNQTLSLEKQEYETENLRSKSSTFNGTVRGENGRMLPSDPGAKPVPQLNQAFGDGLMIQKILTDPTIQQLGNVLCIFDGVHMPIGSIDTLAPLMNKHAVACIGTNVYRLIEDIYKRALSYYTFDEFKKHLDAIEHMDEIEYNMANEEGKEKVKKNREREKLNYFAQGISLKKVKQIQENKKLTTPEQRNKALYEAKFSAMQERLNRLHDIANKAEAKQYAIKASGISIDQMTGVGMPFVKQGTAKPRTIERYDNQGNVVYSHTETPIEMAQRLYDEKLSELNRLPNPPVIPSDRRIVRYTELKPTLSKIAGGNILYQALEHSGAIGDTKLVMAKNVGTLVSIARENGVDVSSVQRGTRAFYDPNTDTMYVVYDQKTGTKKEDILHELVHATTFRLLHQYKVDPTKLTEVQRQACENIEKLMTEFCQDTSLLNNQLFDADDLVKILGVQQRIQALLNQGFIAQAINEFMAYGLTDKRLSSYLKTLSTAESQKQFKNMPKLFEKFLNKPWVGTFKKLLTNLKKLLFGIAAAGINDSVFSQLQLNTVILANQTQNTLTTNTLDAISSPLLFRIGEVNPDLQELLNTLQEQLSIKVQDTNWFNMSFHDLQSFINNNNEDFKETFLTTVSIFSNWSAEQYQVFQMVAMTLGTMDQLNPNTLSLVKDYQGLVSRELQVEDLVTNPNDTFLAQAQYDLLIGNNKNIPENLRLATFFGVVLVDPDIREKLSNINKSLKLPYQGNMDQKFQLWFKNIFNSFAETRAGIKANDSLNKALDRLSRNLVINANTPTTLTQKGEQAAQVFIDKADAFGEKIIDKAAEIATKRAENLANNTHSQIVKNIGKIAHAVVAPIQKGHGETYMDAINLAIQNTKWVPQAFKDLSSDLVGLTNRNAPVYNLIKPVRNMVQKIRNEFIEQFPIVLRSKFKNRPPMKDMRSLNKTLGSIDLSAFGTKIDEGLNLIGDATLRKNKKAELKKLIKSKSLSSEAYKMYMQKCQELASYMVTGKNESNFLLRNADAIANLKGLGISTEVDNSLIEAIDQLISIMAMDLIPAKDKVLLGKYIKNEYDAIVHIAAAVRNVVNEERSKAKSNATWNYRKGYIPFTKQSEGSIIVADIADTQKLVRIGYKKVADYKNHILEGRKKLAYFYNPTNPPQFNQGIIQMVHQTAGGVSILSGYSTEYNGGIIDDPKQVEYITRKLQYNIRNDIDTDTENYVPVFNEQGEIIAYERSVDPEIINALGYPNEDITDRIGRLLGRQSEERLAEEVNRKSVDKIYDDYIHTTRTQRKEGWINVYELAKTDKTVANTLKMIPPETKRYIDSVFGEDTFYVPKDLVEDVIGSSMASIADIFTGRTRLPEPIRKGIEMSARAILGNNAYRVLRTIEDWEMGAMSWARNNIVVRSVFVSYGNTVSNIMQLRMVGVPWSVIFKEIPRKVQELEQLFNVQREVMELRAEIFATTIPGEKEKLQARIDLLEKSYLSKLSIYPLIQEGEFSTIADIAIKPDDIKVSDGKLADYLREKSEFLPDSIKTMLKNGLLTKDSTVYQALQKSVQYGDFIAKAILYDHLTKNKNFSKEAAIRQIREEYVDYDKSRGRFRQYLEATGLSWFYDYKIRSTKVAARYLRHNPFGAIIFSALPAFIPLIPSGTGTIITDNLIAKLFEGGLGGTMGTGMFFRSLYMNPWYNLFN